LQADDVSFPEKNWTDLIDSVVREWLHSVSQLALAGSWKERFHFLDGPFAVDLSLTEDGIIRATLIERRLAREVVHGEHQTELDALLSNACSIADNLLAECDRREWTNPGLKALSAERRQLSNVRRGS
jgi:hypothetical protein